MRKVLLTEWVPVAYVDTEQGRKVQVPGTGCWSKEFTQEGVFHQWGVAYEEFDAGPANYTVGIIEFPGGTVESVHPFRIKFIEP